MDKEIGFLDVQKIQIVKDINVLHELIPPDNTFLHRVNEANEMTVKLSFILNNQRAPNFFIYGLKGTGKTALTLYKLNELDSICKEKGVSFVYTYTNCSSNRAKTAISVMTDIINQLKIDKPFPRIGVTSNYAMDTFEDFLLKRQIKNIIIVLDEFDKILNRSGDEILFYFSRLKDTPKFSKLNLTTIIISNDSKIKENIQDKTLSSFGLDRIDFFQYDALQLNDILKARADIALYPDALGDGVLSKIAATVAANDGDARKALGILSKACSLALNKKTDKISLDIVDESITFLETNLYLETAKRMTVHQKILFLALLLEIKNDRPFSHFIFKMNDIICSKIKKTPLNIRNLQNFLNFFEETGLIEAITKFEKSIHRKTKVISLLIDSQMKRWRKT